MYLCIYVSIYIYVYIYVYRRQKVFEKLAALYSLFSIPWPCFNQRPRFVEQRHTRFWSDSGPSMATYLVFSFCAQLPGQKEKVGPPEEHCTRSMDMTGWYIWKVKG